MGERRPYLIFVTGKMRPPFLIDQPEIEIGRGEEAGLRIDDESVSRLQATLKRTDYDTIILEDGGGTNPTHVNGALLVRPTVLRDGDRIEFAGVAIKFALFDEAEERHQRALYSAAGLTFDANEAPTSTRPREHWAPDSWRKKPVAQEIRYDDDDEVRSVLTKLRKLPPLVTSWEIEELKTLIAEAQEGRRFLLQGGDCAETLEDCGSESIAAKLKILIQMSIVLIKSARRPVIRVGRFAGQYAKPRSKPTEIRNGLELPSYFGDLVNRPAFDPVSRRPDPQLLLTGYLHAAATLNFVRALSAGGFADLRRPEYFDLSYFARADLSPEISKEYKAICREISDSLTFTRAFGDRASDELMKVSFFTSHEGLNLLYETAQTRKVPRRKGYYDLTTHMPWIGERTRALDGAHIEFFRGTANPIAVKLGPTSVPSQIVDLCKMLNPRNEPGKIVLVPRLGAKHVTAKLPDLVSAIERARRRVLWVSDPMHGNSLVTSSGTKTRNFDDILEEVILSMDVHKAAGTYFGGVHFELTGEDVTECVGAGLTEDDLSRNYETLCDPRLNYRQALEMAFAVGRRLSDAPRYSSVPPDGE